MKHYQQLLLASAAAVLLTACGGSSSSTPKNSTPTNKTATGVLSDSPVEGVSYRTNSGITGVTQKDGKFEYVVGEEVIFSLGDFVLGKYTPTHADETVTPVELTQGINDLFRDDAITNLLVLLQSLDNDGNPSNGITIDAGVTFSKESLNLTDSIIEFDANLRKALPEGHTVVTADQANKHFAEQRLKDLAGIYYDRDSHGVLHGVLRINSDGGYTLGQLVEDDGAVGIEVGNLSWDFKTGKVSVNKVILDTQTNYDGETEGAAGFDNANDKSLLFKPTQTQLLIIDGDKEFVPKRFAPATSNNIVGAWAVATKPVEYDPVSDTYKREPISEPSTKLNTQVFIFFADNTYVMLDPVGDDEGDLPNAPPPCGKPGVESGKYKFANNELTFSDLIVDNNGCGGLYSDGYSSQPMKTVINGNIMTWETEVIDGSNYTIPFTLERVNTQIN